MGIQEKGHHRARKSLRLEASLEVSGSSFRRAGPVLTAREVKELPHRGDGPESLY